MGEAARPGSVRADGSADWGEPGVFRVADGVFRIPLPMPQDGLRAVNVYVLVSDDGLTLIDSGWNIPEARTLLERGIKTIGFSMGDITTFLITHLHRDHYELSMHIRQEFGATIALGEGERSGMEMLRRGWVAPFEGQLASLRSMGADSIADRFAEHALQEGLTPSRHEMPDEWIVAGPTMVGNRVIQAVPTPGHTRGHIVFHDERAGLLFSGDHVLPAITPSIGFEAALARNPLGDFMESLRILRRRSDARLLPAHGPVTGSVHVRVDQLLAHHERRLAQTEGAMAAGARTGIQIAEHLTWTRRERSLSELNVFDQMLAVCETASHAELLVAMGRAGSETRLGTTYYWPVHHTSPGAMTK